MIMMYIMVIICTRYVIIYMYNVARRISRDAKNALSSNELEMFVIYGGFRHSYTRYEGCELFSAILQRECA